MLLLLLFIVAWRVITDLVFSHEDDVYCTKYIVKGEKDIKKNHDYTILRQVFDIARDGGDDWVEVTRG